MDIPFDNGDFESGWLFRRNNHACPVVDNLIILTQIGKNG